VSDQATSEAADDLVVLTTPEVAVPSADHKQVGRARITRERSVLIQRFLDDWQPPVLCDAGWFMRPPMKMLFKEKAEEFLTFKARAFRMSTEEFADVYRRIADVSELQGETNLNARCTEAIQRSLRGRTVLDVGCGRGYLVGKIAETHETTGCDIVVNKEVRTRYPTVTFAEATVEDLPFRDDAFDTVVSTHTLEHVQDLPRAVAELRRVARRRLIIVVPCQRPYRYNFSLHINFFPYDWSLVGQLGYRPRSSIQLLGDWFYVEEQD